MIFDTDAQRVILPDPGADVALSPDGKWFANGYRKGHENFYVLYNRVTGEWARSRGFPHPGMTILFPAIADEGTRQLRRWPEPGQPRKKKMLKSPLGAISLPKLSSTSEGAFQHQSTRSDAQTRCSVS